MKVCLINPPQPELRQPLAYVPLGLSYLSSELKKNNHNVTFFNMANKNIVTTPFPESDIYLITCVSSTYREVKRISLLLKAKDKKVVIGGIHPTILPQKVLEETHCDAVVTGEAEEQISKIVESHLIGGVINCGVLKELHTPPDYSIFSEDNIVDTSGIHGQPVGVRATTVLTSRGCPYRCSFCCRIPQTIQVRFIPINEIILIIKLIIKDYKIQHIRFIDDIFTIDQCRTMELCRALKPLGITWVCITRADKVDHILLHEMKSAGCTEVHIGIESGSQRILDRMCKGTQVEDNIRAIETIKKSGIRVKVYTMYGYPGETRADFKKTIEFFELTKPDSYTLSHFTLIPGSKLWYEPDQWFYRDDDEAYLKARKCLNVH